MKSLTKNVGLAFLARIVSMLAGLVVQRYILVAYGSTYNGLTSSISQILSYLVLLEAGLSAASIQALYKPLSESKWEETSGIVKATAISYRHVAYVFAFLLIGVSLLVPIIVSNEIDFLVAGLLTLVTGSSQIVVYFLGGKYIALLTADRKIYIRYLVNIITTSMSAILRVIALNAGTNIVIVQAIHLLCVFFENFILLFYVKVKYKKFTNKCQPAFYAIGKRWNVLIHNIAGLVVNHTDVVLLTVFDSLKTVSIYSVYNNIFVQISNMIQNVFLQAPQGNFGIKYAKDKNEYNKSYHIYETLFTIVLFIIASCGLVLALSFVSIYTRGIPDADNYTEFALPVLFALILLMNQIRIPVLITINSTGSYKETQNGAIVEAIINLSVSLMLYFFTPLGMYGMLIGTIASYIYRTTELIVFTYRKLLKQPLYDYLRLIITNLIMFLLVFVVFYIWAPIHADGYVEWIVKAFIICILLSILYLCMNLLLNYKDTKNSIVYIFGVIRKQIRRTK